MKTAVALALLSTLCVLGQSVSSLSDGNTRANIQRDLQNVIDSVTSTQNTAIDMVKSTASMKLKRQMLCWKLAANRVLSTALPANNALTQLYQEFDDLSKKLPTATDEEINGYLFTVLEGTNSYVTRTLATGNGMMTNINNQIKALGLDFTC
ncbi:hypothetical protein GE061_003119 [Apolygus lucorum]|uniref:Uncharacterized protein n=1 Tax=Apolygus lucorum TaxID=248454 RepID=A0A6A4J4M7_APOLU|nr:hypothetical protein GE061_003119 [Apolygus lucorum]